MMEKFEIERMFEKPVTITITPEQAEILVDLIKCHKDIHLDWEATVSPMQTTREEYDKAAARYWNLCQLQVFLEGGEG